MKIAIITGASSGMGNEFARQIAKKKGIEEIWVVARRTERLAELKSELEATYKLKVRPVALDLTKAESITELKNLLASEKPDVKFLVNASGFGKYGTYRDLTDEEITQMIDVNCKSVVLITNAVLPYMNAGGRVLIMGSSSSFQPLPSFNMYASTKAFIVHFARALNYELKDRKIYVTCLCPGFVNTEFFKVAKETKNPDACNNFKPMYEAKDVVRKGLRDSKRKKDMSVLGLDTKFKHLTSRILPAWLEMRVWMMIK